MFKLLCIVVVVVFVGLLAFSIHNAIKVSKRNKASNAASQKIFMSKIEKEIRDNSDDVKTPINYGVNNSPKDNTTDLPEQKKDADDLEEELYIPDGVSLKDFYKP